MLRHMQLCIYVNIGTDKIVATVTDMKMNTDVDIDTSRKTESLVRDQTLFILRVRVSTQRHCEG